MSAGEIVLLGCIAVILSPFALVWVAGRIVRAKTPPKLKPFSPVKPCDPHNHGCE